MVASGEAFPEHPELEGKATLRHCCINRRLKPRGRLLAQDDGRNADMAALSSAILLKYLEERLEENRPAGATGSGSGAVRRPGV